MPEGNGGRPASDPPRGAESLTYKQRLFVSYYLGISAGNATDAARRAGYAWPDRAGAKLVVKSSIRAAIDSSLSGAALSAEEILARLSEIATADLGDFLHIGSESDWSVDLKRARRLRKLGVVRKIKAGQFGTEIQLHDSLKALIKLGEYHRLWKPEKKVDKTLADHVAAAEKRAIERKRERDRHK